MEHPRAFHNPTRSLAGIISRVRLENFMCHSNLEIELGDRLNFITGQNGSGKSAILTALCVAFGSRAKGTQRANTMKDFIKTGCSYALVHLELRNQGEDAFKHETYGDLIILERRITESGTSTVLKNHQGRKVAGRKEDLQEIIVHFNIDVENPCVVMSQDKSREFLHSGNAKDKFKFFYKATLLQRLEELLKDIDNQLDAAIEVVGQLEKSLRPVQLELEDLEKKIKSMEQVEEISLHVQLMKKKLAWAWVYDVDRQLIEKTKLIEKLKKRIPACQKKIDEQNEEMKRWEDKFGEKRQQIDSIFSKASEVRRKREDLEQSLSLAKKEKMQLEVEHERNTSYIQKVVKRGESLAQHIHEIKEKHIMDTQDEESEIEEELKKLEFEVNEAYSICQRLKEEDAIFGSMTALRGEIDGIMKQSSFKKSLFLFNSRKKEQRKGIAKMKQ